MRKTPPRKRSSRRTEDFAISVERFLGGVFRDRKSTRLNSSHLGISYAVFCLKKKKKKRHPGLGFIPGLTAQHGRKHITMRKPERRKELAGLRIRGTEDIRARQAPSDRQIAT